MIVIDLMGSEEETNTVTPKKEESREEKKPLPRKRLSIININGEIVDVED